MTKDKERDIDEKRKLANILEALPKLRGVDPWRDDLFRAAAILRGDEQPKPDRAEALWEELWETASGEDGCLWKAVIRRHFDELRAEIEAERPAVVVPFGDDVIAAARFYADVPVAESRIVIMANAILDGAKGDE